MIVNKVVFVSFVFLTTCFFNVESDTNISPTNPKLRGPTGNQGQNQATIQAPNPDDIATQQRNLISQLTQTINNINGIINNERSNRQEFMTRGQFNKDYINYNDLVRKMNTIRSSMRAANEGGSSWTSEQRLQRRITHIQRLNEIIELQKLIRNDIKEAQRQKEERANEKRDLVKTKERFVESQKNENIRRTRDQLGTDKNSYNQLLHEYAKGDKLYGNIINQVQRVEAQLADHFNFDKDLFNKEKTILKAHCNALEEHQKYVDKRRAQKQAALEMQMSKLQMQPIQHRPGVPNRQRYQG